MVFSIHRSAIFAGRILSGSAKAPQNQIEERWVERPEVTLFVENRGRFFDGRLVTLIFGPLERLLLRGLYVDEPGSDYRIDRQTSSIAGRQRIWIILRWWIDGRRLQVVQLLLVQLPGDVTA